jgi:segregation and condensation protein A
MVLWTFCSFDSKECNQYLCIPYAKTTVPCLLETGSVHGTGRSYSVFIKMAADLLYIKSRMLLMGFGVRRRVQDPRQEIGRSLAEYQNTENTPTCAPIPLVRELFIRRKSSQFSVPSVTRSCLPSKSLQDMLATFSRLMTTLHDKVFNVYDRFRHEKIALMQELF